MVQHSFPLMIFAAGFGTRMGALVRETPKPLLLAHGRPLLDRAITIGRMAGAAPIVVNTHYLGHRIRDHLAAQPEIRIADEADRILDTGGGLRHALPLLGPAPAVMTLNPDVVWPDVIATGKGEDARNPLRLLAAHWRPDRMDGLLLVREPAGLPGRRGGADFIMRPDGRIRRARDGAAPDERGVVYLGAGIICPHDIHHVTEEVFSLNVLWDRMIARDRLFALCYPGGWCDAGTPEGLREADALLARAERGRG